MTGPELYREAVSLAHDDYIGCACEMTCCVHEQVQLQRAQVLATLALAAATALGHLVDGGPMGADRKAWIATASEHPGQQRRISEANAEFEEATA